MFDHNGGTNTKLFLTLSGLGSLRTNKISGIIGFPRKNKTPRVQHRGVAVQGMTRLFKIIIIVTTGKVGKHAAAHFLSALLQATRMPTRNEKEPIMRSLENENGTTRSDLCFTPQLV